MPWVRFDDQFPIHRKMTGLSDAAFRLHVLAIFWCARNLTDGVVPEEDLDDVCGARVRTPARFVIELLKRRAWHEIGAQCDSEDCPAHPDNAVTNGTTETGWVIHDYLEYQFSKERVERDREATAARQKKWRDQQKQGRKKRNGVSNGRSNGVSNDAPSRPDPKGRGSVDESLSRRNAHATDDEDQNLIQTIIGVLADETGRTVDAEHAAKVAAGILDGRPVDQPIRYVVAAIRGNPRQFLPAQGNPASAPVGQVLREALPDANAGPATEANAAFQAERERMRQGRRPA